MDKNLKILSAITIVCAMVLVGTNLIMANGMDDFLEDCGKNSYCFEQRAKECKPVKSISVYTTELGRFFLQYEIKGVEGNDCVFGLKVLGVETDSFEELEMLKGKEAVCLIPLEYVSVKGVFSIKESGERCSGTLVEELWQK